MALSTPCKLVSPGAVVHGTMSITKSELYFEMDEDDTENKTVDPEVGPVSILANFYNRTHQGHMARTWHQGFEENAVYVVQTRWQHHLNTVTAGHLSINFPRERPPPTVGK